MAIPRLVYRGFTPGTRRINRVEVDAVFSLGALNNQPQHLEEVKVLG